MLLSFVTVKRNVTAASKSGLILGVPPSASGHVGQSVGHLTRMSEVLGLIPGLATYFHFSFR